MDFPTGHRQPSQVISEDLLDAVTPEGLLGIMRRDALEIGAPVHERFYIGHNRNVNDPPLSTFFMYNLERPLHYETEEIPKGNYLRVFCNGLVISYFRKQSRGSLIFTNFEFT